MAVDSTWLDWIYEAAVVTDRWPALLGELARHHGGLGAIVFTRTPAAFDWIADLDHQGMAQDYIDGQWYLDPYPQPLVREMHPGFRCGTDYYSVAEIEAFPVNRDFLRPRGINADVSTIIQGPANDVLQISIIGFPTHEASGQAVAALDSVRPHLARALSLTSQILAARAQATVSSLALGGIAAAIVASDGRLKAMNTPFELRMGDRCHTVRHRLRFADPFLDRQFTEELRAGFANRQVRSTAARIAFDEPPLVVHLVPLRGGARDVADSDGVLVMIANASNASMPDADVLRLLFDLTPAEARIVRLLIDGQTLAAAAAALTISINTARVHLRSVFSKTGVSRQVDLVTMLSGLGRP